MASREITGMSSGWALALALLPSVAVYGPRPVGNGKARRPRCDL